MEVNNCELESIKLVTEQMETNDMSKLSDLYLALVGGGVGEATFG
jgi:hypothetical protein